MEYFRIADINFSVEWEDKEGRDELYDRCDLPYNPPFLSTYVLNDIEVGEIKEFDMHVCMAKCVEELPSIPDKYTNIDWQFYYKVNGNFMMSIIDIKEDKKPIWTLSSEEDFKKVKLIPHSPQNNSYSLNLIDVIFQQMMPKYNGLVIHGAGIEYKGTGIIFSAFSGTGKTTQARLWRKYRDAIVVNGDCPIIKNTENGPYMYGSPWCGTSGESINKRTPLKAIVLVNQSKENYVEEVTGDDAVLAVFTNILYYSQDESDLDRLLPVLTQIVSQIKVYKLFCNMEEEAVDTLEKALQKDNILL